MLFVFLSEMLNFPLPHLWGYAPQIIMIMITVKGLNKYVKLATLVEGDRKAPFSIATTPKCRGGRYSIIWIAPLYP